MAKKIFNTQLELLQDTINYFWGKPERQCKQGMNCFYTPIGQSEGCAIGRLLEPELAAECENRGGAVDIQFIHLPDWLKDMKLDFLKLLQICHDCDFFKDEYKGEILRRFRKFVDVGKLTFPE